MGDDIPFDLLIAFAVLCIILMKFIVCMICFLMMVADAFCEAPVQRITQTCVIEGGQGPVVISVYQDLSLPRIFCFQRMETDGAEVAFGTYQRYYFFGVLAHGGLFAAGGVR